MFSHQEGVRVHHLSEQMAAKQREAMLLDLISAFEVERIRVVLDCSGISHLNRGMVMLMLSYLEAAMKCNGDVRLAAMPPLIAEKLMRMGITQLFEIHATTDGAVQSFYRRRYSLVGMADQTVASVEKFALVA